MNDSQRVRLESVLPWIKTEELEIYTTDDGSGYLADMFREELAKRDGELREVPGEVDRSEDGALFGLSSDL